MACACITCRGSITTGDSAGAERFVVRMGQGGGGESMKLFSSFRKTVLKRIAGRDQPVWRALPFPKLRHALFRDDLDTVIHGLIASQSRVRFIQIGSNDGIFCDPLWTFRRYPNWFGILVEPVEPLFRMLAANYAPWARR